MPTLNSPDWGNIEYRSEDVLVFPEGVPSFEHLRRFILVRTEQYTPFYFLTSEDRPAIRFPCLAICLLDPAYRAEVTQESSASGIFDPGEYSVGQPDILLLAVVTLPRDGEPTANLLAPVLIDSRRRVGAQIVLEGARYSHVTPLPGRSPTEGQC
jgi:flagellar assembly factor FliW